MAVAEKPALHPWEREVRHGGRSPVTHHVHQSHQSKES